MLIRFITENFLSFNSESEISLIANKERRLKDHLFQSNEINILKTSVIYGANASGKSNLVKAISFAQKVILLGVEKVNPVNCHFRFSEENVHKPSKFCFEIKAGNKYYSYGFGLLFKSNMILEEWLYEIGKSKELKVFERFRTKDGNHIIDLGLKLNGENKKRFEVYKKDLVHSDDQLFLTEINRKSISDIPNIEPFIDVFSWIKNNLVVLFPHSKFQGLDFIGDNEEMTKTFKNFLNILQTGINNVISEEIEFEKLDIPSEIKNSLPKSLEKSKIVIIEVEGARYSFMKDKNEKIIAKKIGLIHRTHNGNNVVFDILNESDGTQRLFDFIPAIHQLAKSNKVFIIDELDRSLHSKLSYSLIELFLHLGKNNESQLIVTTHESLLLDLDLLRRDEIWFIEKEKDSSRIYSLDEFRVRNDKIIRKDYLLGRYGAIPIFKSFKNIEI